MFWVISVYFNIRNTLPKSGTFLLGHSVYAVHLVVILCCVCRAFCLDVMAHIYALHLVVMSWPVSCILL